MEKPCGSIRKSGLDSDTVSHFVLSSREINPRRPTAHPGLLRIRPLENNCPRHAGMRRDNAASSTRQVKDMYGYIRIEHIKENNLKDISVEIPYHKHTVIAGVSGSGKSTLAYDVIYATAQRRLLDCMSDQEKIFPEK